MNVPQLSNQGSLASSIPVYFNSSFITDSNNSVYFEVLFVDQFGNYLHNLNHKRDARNAVGVYLTAYDSSNNSLESIANSHSLQTPSWIEFNVSSRIPRGLNFMKIDVYKNPFQSNTSACYNFTNHSKYFNSSIRGYQKVEFVIDYFYSNFTDCQAFVTIDGFTKDNSSVSVPGVNVSLGSKSILSSNKGKWSFIANYGVPSIIYAFSQSHSFNSFSINWSSYQNISLVGFPVTITPSNSKRYFSNSLLNSNNLSVQSSSLSYNISSK